MKIINRWKDEVGGTYVVVKYDKFLTGVEKIFEENLSAISNLYCRRYSLETSTPYLGWDIVELIHGSYVFHSFLSMDDLDEIEKLYQRTVKLERILK